MDTIYNLNGYKLHLMKTKKFKNISISLRLQNKLTREETTLRTLLTFVLIGATEKYQTSRELSAYLDDMYGARLSNNIYSRGKSHIMQLSLSCVNENYLPQHESLIEKQIELINDLFYHPYVIDGHFDDKIVEMKKKELKERLEAANDDKFSYSLDKLFDFMGKGQTLGIRSTGYIEDIDKITSTDLYNYLLKCINEDKKNIYVVGDIDESIVDVFREHLAFPEVHKDYESAYSFVSHKDEVLEMIESQDIVQAKLNLGYVIDCNYTHDDNYAFSVFNAYFGGFSQSRLFQVVREKNSLCYYISSSYDSFNGMMVVSCGIESGDYHKTMDLIAQELKKIQEGEIDEEGLKQSIGMLTDSLIKSQDDPSSMISLQYNRDITGCDIDNAGYLKKLQEVTKEDVIRVSKKVKLDTIYLLKGAQLNENI